MSRSIHTTQEHIAQVRRADYADPVRKLEELRRLRRALGRKRRIKAQFHTTRQAARLPADGSGLDAPCDVETIPIQTDAGSGAPHVHHLTDAEELRALLRVLPPGLADGLSAIDLEYGNRHASLRAQDDDCRPDPLTGRPGCEIATGIYCWVFLGTYRPWSASVQLYAHVYDAAKVPLPLPLCELYLKLRTLTTFVHELAHHFDERERVGRGRWLARDKTLVERYAEDREYAWGREYVVPFLQSRYPEEVEALLGWIEDHGGVRLSLAHLAGEPRHTGKQGLYLLRGNPERGFLDWLTECHAKGFDRRASRFAFAREMHYADEYELCLAGLDGLLAGGMLTPRVWTFKGDTLTHLERYDEAEVCLRRALELDAGFIDAWVEHGRVAEGRKDWPGALANAERILALSEGSADLPATASACRFAAVACCALGRPAEMENWIERLIANAPEEARAKRRYHARRMVCRRAGKLFPVGEPPP